MTYRVITFTVVITQILMLDSGINLMFSLLKWLFLLGFLWAVLIVGSTMGMIVLL